jgi:hypothetical protein
VDAAEAAVAEDDDDIAALNIFGDMGDDGVRVGQIGGGFAGRSELLHQLFRVEAFFGREQFQPRDLGDDDGIGIGKGGGQFVLENIAAGGVGAGLKNGADFFAGVLDAQGAEGLADGGGMMAEIINHGDAAGDAFDFHPALDALEGIEGTLDLLVGETAVLGDADDGEGVADIQLADEVQMKLEAGDFKFGRGGAKAQVEGLHGIVFAEAEFFHRTMGDIQQGGEVGVIAVAEQQAIAGDEADEMAEGFFDGGEVFKNVGVVKFEVVDDRDFGLVMDELAAFIEKRGVVFVALDDEPFAIGEARALGEIVRDATDEVAGVEAVVFKDPGEQGGGGGFAVGAADDEGAFAADEKFAEQFGERAVAEFVIECVLGFRVAAGDGVADDDEIRLVGEVALVVAIHHRDFFGGKE